MLSLSRRVATPRLYSCTLRSWTTASTRGTSTGTREREQQKRVELLPSDVLVARAVLTTGRAGGKDISVADILKELPWEVTAEALRAYQALFGGYNEHTE